MSEEAKSNLVDVPEPAAAPTQRELPSREDLKDWSPAEIESAEKRGLIKKKEDKPKTEPKAEAPKASDKPTEPAKGPAPEKKPEPQKSTLPDFTFKTPEQEKAFLDAFGSGTPQRAMYFRMKNERENRQRVQRELEAERAERQRMAERLAAFERGTGKSPEPEVDEQGNVVDPDDKPLTLRQIKEMQKRETEEREKTEREHHDVAGKLAEAHRSHEEFARESYEDFDGTLKLAAEVMQKMDELLPDVKAQKKAIKLIKDLQMAAANAHNLSIDDYNETDIAYELGKLHPGYGKKSDDTDQDGNSNKPEKANGGLTPEQMKRIETNTQRRVSSASIPGNGGKRQVSASDISLADLNRMDYAQRAQFKTKFPERYAQLLRG